MLLHDNDRLMTVEEVAEMLRLAVPTVRAYLAEGKIERLKVFGQTRIRKSEAERHIIRGRTEWRADAFTARRGQSL
jgi:excisionase family DNA binding protein